MAAKMKALEEQHQDYQRHIAVLKESLCAKEEHYSMLQTDVSYHVLSQTIHPVRIILVAEIMYHTEQIEWHNTQYKQVVTHYRFTLQWIHTGPA